MPRLTEHEQRILDLVSEGLGNGLIAERLVIAKTSVESALDKIFTKLNCQGRDRGYVPRVEAVRWNLWKT